MQDSGINIRNVINIMGLLSHIMARVGCFALFAMMCITVVDVVGRYAFNSPMLGAFEITEFLVLVTVFSFLGYAQSEKSHVTVDILVNLFSKKKQNYIDLFNYTISFILILLVSWKGFEKAIEAFGTGEKPMNLSVPDYPFVFFMSFGCAVMCVELIRDVIKTFFKK